MVSHYTAIVFISVLSMFIMILGAQSNSFMPIRRKRNFQLLFFLLIVSNLSEWLAAYLNGAANDLRTLHIVAKFIELMLTPVIPIVSVEAIGGDKNTKLMSIPAKINVVLQIVSLFTGVVFSVDAENMYHRGSLYSLYVMLFVSGIIFLIIHCFRFSQQYQSKNILFLMMIVLLVVGVMVMQIVASQLRLDWTCVSIAAIMFYIYYDQLVQQVDHMTRLLNRRSYDCRIESFHEPAAILFFDVNRFKYVNDTYGHSFGDECLINISAEIRRIFENYGECYRFGGDEFCVIMTDNTENTEKLISKYLHQMESLSEDESRLPSVSVGYVLFEPTKESIDEAIKRADRTMYEFKEKQNAE